MPPDCAVPGPAVPMLPRLDVARLGHGFAGDSRRYPSILRRTSSSKPMSQSAWATSEAPSISSRNRSTRSSNRYSPAAKSISISSSAANLLNVSESAHSAHISIVTWSASPRKTAEERSGDAIEKSQKPFLRKWHGSDDIYAYRLKAGGLQREQRS
jgi:hypothetical protein